MRTIYKILLIISIFHISSQQNEIYKISLEQTDKGMRKFIDSAGRQRIFHGVNAVVKGPPWVPDTSNFNVDSSLVEQDFQLLEDLGLNQIRLGSMWPGVEPEEGKFNETYIQELQKITAMAKKHGIYILLDMHQDVLSEKYCGEGIPAFAADDYGLLKFPEPLGKPFTEYWDREFQFPERKDCDKFGWGNLYFAQATGTAFQSLYKNFAYLKKWTKFWAKLTESFKNQPEILGVELINEPWAGNTVANPTLLLPGVADKENLQPAYDYISEAIWKIDPQMLVFFAGVTWDDFAKAGFKSAPGGSKNANRSVFAFHYYEPPQYNLEPYLNTRFADAERLNTGIMLTETGRPEPNQKVYEERLSAWDKLHLSWSFWEYKSFCIEASPKSEVSQWDEFGSCKTGYGGNMWNSNGTERTESTINYARPYARAVAGKLVDNIFTPASANLQVRWVSDTKISEPTEIYISERFYYKGGYDVTILPFDSVQMIKVKTNILHFKYYPDSQDQQVISVTINRRNNDQTE